MISIYDRASEYAREQGMTIMGTYSKIDKVHHFVKKDPKGKKGVCIYVSKGNHELLKDNEVLVRLDNIRWVKSYSYAPPFIDIIMTKDDFCSTAVYEMILSNFTWGGRNRLMKFSIEKI